VILTPIQSSSERFQTKIKIFIKNLDNVSINFSANDLMKDLGRIEKSLYNLKNLIEAKTLP